MKVALITLSEQGAQLAAELAARLGECEVYVHADVPAQPHLFVVQALACSSADRLKPELRAKTFPRIVDLVPQLWNNYRGLVFIAPTGLVVRAIAPCIRHKTTDPAVVAVDVAGRWAVSLLSGHEGGANDLAMAVANILDAEPVISTTTEAAKTLIVGIGCRRGTPAGAIIDAINAALATAGATLDQVRLLASADIKADEPGLIDAAHQLNIPIRFVSSQALRDCTREFARSEFVQQKVDLPAVAEPAALLAGRRTRLRLKKQIFPSVTVAIAQERCLWSA